MDTKTAQKQLVSLITEHLSDSIPVTRILTYKPSANGAVTGRFESSGRVYNFMFNGMEARYKPAMNADSALFSDYYLERFDAVVAPVKGARALPNCTSKSYSCKGDKGVGCVPLTKHCRMGSSAIGNERLGKIKSMSKSLAANGEDTEKVEATRAKIVEGRMAMAVENRAKREPKKVEKQPKRNGVEAINEKRKSLETKQAAMQEELRKIRDVIGKNEAYYDLSSKIDKYAGLLENYSLNPEVKKGQEERYNRRQEQFKKEMEAIFASTPVAQKATPEYKGKSTPFTRKAKTVVPVAPAKKEKATKTKKTPELTTKEMQGFMDGLRGAISTVAPISQVDTFKIDPKTRAISGTYTSNGAKFAFAINRDGSITTKSTKAKKRTDSVDVQCNPPNRPCTGEKGTRCVPPEESCRVDTPKTVAAGTSVLNHLDRLLDMHGVDAFTAKYQEMSEGSKKVADKKEPKPKDKDLEEDFSDSEKEEGDGEYDPKYERRKALVYFSHNIHPSEMGITEKEQDRMSDRELRKRLKDHAATLTKNKITGFDFDSDGSMHFKEAVPHEYDHNPNQPLWAQINSGSIDVKPQYKPEGEVNPQYDPSKPEKWVNPRTNRYNKKYLGTDVSSMKLLPRG